MTSEPSEHKVPGDVTDSGARVRDRGAETAFARLPESEVHARTGPGGGPQGPVAAGPVNIPVILITTGYLVAFLTFLVATPILLVLGLGMIFVGGVMSVVTNRRPGRMSGLGTSEVADAPPSDRGITAKH